MRADQAHAVLARHDRDLPGLPVLLDESALGERLGAPVTRSYLRYKPGTSATALLQVDGRAAIAATWADREGAKRAKAMKHTGAPDVLLDAPDLLVLDAMADRELPALRHLVRTGRLGRWLARHGVPVATDARLSTLAHKPARRWVARMPVDAGPCREGRDHVVLRAYAASGFARALTAHRRFDPGPDAGTGLRLPRLRAVHRRGLIALEHLPGRTLDGTVDAQTTEGLGAAIGEVHARGRTSEPVPPRPAAGFELAFLEPVLGAATADAAAVGARACASLRRSSSTVIHGDLSLDQVVDDHGSLGLIDLDRVRPGNPLDDIASLLAAAGLAALTTAGTKAGRETIARLRAPFVTGYASTWTGPLGDDLGPRTSLALLDRAGEPFRSGHPEWPDITGELITLAGLLADGRVTA